MYDPIAAIRLSSVFPTYPFAISLFDCTASVVVSVVFSSVVFLVVYEDYQYGIYLDKNVIGTKDCGLEVIAGRDGEYYSLQEISIYNGEKGE